MKHKTKEYNLYTKYLYVSIDVCMAEKLLFLAKIPEKFKRYIPTVKYFISILKMNSSSIFIEHNIKYPIVDEKMRRFHRLIFLLI